MVKSADDNYRYLPISAPIEKRATSFFVHISRFRAERRYALSASGCLVAIPPSWMTKTPTPPQHHSDPAYRTSTPWKTVVPAYIIRAIAMRMIGVTGDGDVRRRPRLSSYPGR